MNSDRRIDQTSSRTAAYTCMCRAASYLARKPHLRSGDAIAVRLLPHFIRLLLRLHLLNLNGRISPRGIYPYVIARTHFIDRVFREALESGIRQVLILGAGFDSRSIRLADAWPDCRVFEVDTGHTQQAKLKQFRKRGIAKPANTIYVPVDFEKEDLLTRLTDNHYDPAAKTLFILEGLMMYLSQEAVDDTFAFMYRQSAPGSRLVFDYIHAAVLRQEGRYYGEKAIYRRVSKDRERWIFGIEEGEIEAFLEKRHFHLREHLDAADMEQRYFSDESGQPLTRVNGTHCLVLAERI